MKKLIVVLATVALFGVAAAQPAPKPAPAPKGAEGGGKVKVYDFSGDTIEGDLVKPEGSTVDAREFGKHSSLINIRKHFIPEIIKSAEDL